MKNQKQLPLVDNCWSQIGVRGNRSCERLKEVIHCQNCEVFSRIARGLLDRPASGDYLSEVTEFVAEPADARTLANQSVLMFSVNDEHYAVWARDVLEVAEVTAPRRIPHRTNQTFRGLVNIQGRLELCVSLAGLLGLAGHAEREHGKVRVLVVSHANQRWVFVIDAVRGMHRVHQDALVEVPASSARRDHAYLSGLLQHQGIAFGMLSVPRLCASAGEHTT